VVRIAKDERLGDLELDEVIMQGRQAKKPASN
jgi:hypothetical protein